MPNELDWKWTWKIVEDLQTLTSAKFSKSDTPFLSMAFLSLLAKSKSVDADTGWHSHHIAVYDKQVADDTKALIALVPCYLKAHSYGEYVFDHSWAHAYQQHQLRYYPKLACAIPFTPVSGSRALLTKAASDQGVCEHDILSFVAQHKTAIVESVDASSLHLLFPKQSISDTLVELGMHQRMSVQFVWTNQLYASFDDFMQMLTSRKRRSIRKERKPFVESSDSSDANNAPIQIKTLTSGQLTQDVVDDFYLCYQQTYLKRSGHHGYLSAEFFAQLLTTMKDSVCVIAAYKASKMFAGSLFFYDDEGLYGRYWGALQDVSGLHFECCYYRGIEFAIAQGIKTFNPGTQGEHKILRGFVPTFCYSNHYMLEGAFDKAVADFVVRERPAIEQYHSQAMEVLPYKNNDD
ncbi:GNAT family N-acetyltransferase [Ningiella sp. W23]|uniref:GNAT family N-acetyltransferase n=1 Tax=Ningiella sp. W23 TaxID=3023715 RepID=UPI003757A532